MSKKIFVFLITIPLIAFGFLILNFKRAEKIEAQSWLSGWSYRKSHVINAASGAVPNYQVKIVVWSGTGTDSGENVYLNNNALNWPNDIRFTDNDGTTPLDHWLEGSDATSATFWVEVADDLSTSNQTIYIYYGKSGESSASNGANTFNFFDDFPGTSLDAGKWTAYANNYSVSSSILRINVGGIERTSAFLFNIQNGYMAETRVKHEVSAANYGGVLPEVASSPYTAGSNANADATILYMRNAGSNTVYYWIGNGSAASYNVGVGSTGWTPTTGTWYITGISVKSGTVKLWRNRAVGNTFSGITWAKNITYVKLGSFHRSAAYDIQDTSYDWVLVRKYTDPEPSHGAWGEETPPPSVEKNVSGWAWSENIGWISFNNTTGGGPVDYGVNIDPTTGNFSGYAWSEHIGWIKFDPVGPYPAIPNNYARIDFGTMQVSGWARACAGAADVTNCSGGTNPNSGGWDGWIKLRDTALWDGVWIETGAPLKPFHGWAWGSDVVGWISFNDLNTGAPVDYQVITSLNFPPTASNLSWSDKYCDIQPGVGQVSFKWTYRDPDLDLQSQFDFRVNNVNDVNDPNPEVDRSFTGLSNPDGTVNTQTVKVVSPIQSDKITYNTSYYWWVRVWDNQGKNSGWVPGLTSFTTELHAKPWVDFNRCPLSPTVDEITQFCSKTETGICDAANCLPPSEVPPPPIRYDTTCYDIWGAKVLCSTWEWDFGDGSPLLSSTENPTYSYSTSGDYKGKLTVYDGDGFSCSYTESTTVTLPIPEWREIPPF